MPTYCSLSCICIQKVLNELLRGMNYEPRNPQETLKLGQRLMDGFYASRDSIRTVLLLPVFSQVRQLQLKENK